MKVLTMSFNPAKDNKGIVEVVCVFGEREVRKPIPITVKPIRFSVVFDDSNELADMEVVTSQ